MCPRRLGKVGHPTERVSESVACKVKVRQVPEGGDRKFGQDTKVGTTSVAREGDTTKLGYLRFYSGGMLTIKWGPTGGQVSGSSRSPRGNPSSDTIHKLTGSSAIPTPEYSCKILTLTPRLGEYHPTRVPKRLTLSKRSDVNLYESSSMLSVEGMHSVEAS